MRGLIFALVGAFLFLLSGCTSCGENQILVGNECCLDLDNNRICDSDDFKIASGEYKKFVIVESDEPKTFVVYQYESNYIQKPNIERNVQVWEAKRRLEQEERDYKAARKNWKRIIDNEVIYGYDERYDKKWD